MTRKDYIAIAGALKNVRHQVQAGSATPDFREGGLLAHRTAVMQIAAVLARDNARFDCQRFFTACGMPD